MKNRQGDNCSELRMDLAQKLPSHAPDSLNQPSHMVWLTKAGPMDQRVRKIEQLLRENLNREWSLAELAESVNLSVWRLSHIFRTETGTSPIQYLRELRMNRAKELLETSFLSVKEIAYHIGINDESHFVRDFKKIYGDPPTRYRSRFSDMSQVGGSDDRKRAALDNAVENGENRRSKSKDHLAKAAKRSILPFINFITYFIGTNSF